MLEAEIGKLRSELPPNVKLVAVSKFHPFEMIVRAYEAGQRTFAESRPQELRKKVMELEELKRTKGEDFMKDVEWHFIGHLQTNKLKMVLPYVSLVQSVDSVRLLDAIQDWCQANGKTVSVLLEMHVASEESKQGLTDEEIINVLDATVKGAYGSIRFCGLMGMATYTDEKDVIRGDFGRIHRLYEKIISGYPSLPSFGILSMGMSGDYEIAIENGSNMVRIGSRIFGPRN